MKQNASKSHGFYIYNYFHMSYLCYTIANLIQPKGTGNPVYQCVCVRAGVHAGVHGRVQYACVRACGAFVRVYLHVCIHVCVRVFTCECARIVCNFGST